ncbi:MBL fold metallo-hydrolase [Aneurinibacillus tyrosinisolvens]|uniref:MBL fold metallo-hydrolase n=1 Tax=Aneurinibacillus tyrosinisolvens TaxID=1443435 RepID=UPI00063FA272|nr:MBL fold metallo-hydrolase [Aneurinibacillus tyrosinisolvens]
MKIQLVRHATLVLQLGGKRILVDPMLGEAESMTPAANSANTRRNPLVPLPVDVEEVTDVDAVLVTHMHRDHFDDTAASVLSKGIPIFCQPGDEEKFEESGFSNVHPVDEVYIWNGVEISRTGGRHGTGEVGRQMGPVSGFILEVEEEPSIYIAGDTIYCSEVEEALRKFKPQISVVNAGAAQFLLGDPITMTAEDVGKVCRYLPETKVVAVHLEAFNHCLLSRNELQNYLEGERLSNQVLIPQDGESLVL